MSFWVMPNQTKHAKAVSDEHGWNSICQQVWDLQIDKDFSKSMVPGDDTHISKQSKRVEEPQLEGLLQAALSKLQQIYDLLGGLLKTT